jgi:hypothetical protein
MSHNDGNLLAFLVFGFGAGLASFFKGFRTYRKFRVLEDTPEIPIRSVPMGLVHVHGKAAGQEQVLSPVTHTPCFFYKVKIEKWQRDRSSGRWTNHGTDSNGVRFYLEDGSGQVLVDGQGAELDLAATCKREATGDHSYEVPAFSESTLDAMTGIEATDAELLSYVTRVERNKIVSLVGRGLEALGPVSEPQKGSQGEAAWDFFKHPLNPDSMQRMMSAAGPLTDPNQEQARQAMMEALRHPVGTPEFEQNLQRAADATGADAEQIRKLRDHVQSWQRFRESGVTFNPPPASGRYRFTEYCIVPDQDYDITGTCVENPDARGDHDRNLITKGQNEPTFLISYRSEKELESNLRNRAALMVFGGGTASVACLGILLAKLGWL